MQGTRPAGVLLVLAALLLMAFAAPGAAAAAYSGRVVTSHAAAGTRATAHLNTSAFMRRMEDEVAPEMMTWAASLDEADGGDIGLDQSKQVCLQVCSDSGQPYTGRGCQAIYGCRP